MTKVKRNVRKEVQQAIQKLRLTDNQLANTTMDTFIRACYRQGLSEKETVAQLRRETKCLYDIFNKYNPDGTPKAQAATAGK
jgi:intergrase/recombinase